MRSQLFISLLAAAVASVSAQSERIPGAFILELEDGEDGTLLKARSADGVEVRNEFNHELFKGMAIQINDVDNADELARDMASRPDVKNVWPMYRHAVSLPEDSPLPIPVADSATSLKRRDTTKPGLDNFSTHLMTQVDRMHAEGYTGKGVKIAIVDTGIEYTHPALGGCFGKGCLVSFGRDMVGDNYNGVNQPVPDDDPNDTCYGHGTFVAGVIAAQPNPLNFTGVAPGVTLGAYRILGCVSTPIIGDDVLISTWLKAVDDGADIISASLGFASGWSEGAWSSVVSRIVESGVHCVFSVGNDGSEGMFAPESASTAKGALSVASFSNTVYPIPQIPITFSVDGKQPSQVGYQPAFPNNWPEKPLPLYVVGLSTDKPGDLCRPPPADTPDLSNYIVAFTGDCAFVEIIERATQLGAKYVLFYYPLPTPAFLDWSGLNIEAAGLLLGEVANSMIAPLKSGSQVMVDMHAGGDMFVVNVENSFGGAVARSSTQGPSFEGDLKPQIGAPGEGVLSTMMESRGSYAIWTGTSFSCPFVAGVIALLIEARGPTSPAEMEQLLMTHAKQQIFNDRAKFYDYLAPVPQQGAGLVQAYDSAFSTLAVQPASIALNDSEHAVTKAQITLHNTGKKAVTYKLSHVPAGTSYTLAKDSIYPVMFPGDIVKTYGSLHFSHGSVTLAAGQKTTVDVMPTAPQGLVSERLPVWSGYIAVNGSDGSSATVAYQGIAGSLRAATVLGADAATVLLDDGTAAPSNTTFLLPTPGRENGVDAKLPTLNVMMALGTRIIRADLVPHGQESIGQLDGFPKLFQSRVPFSISWNGKLASGQFAPAGTYTVAFSALRLNGDEQKDEDWDRAETAPFSVQYQ